LPSTIKQLESYGDFKQRSNLFLPDHPFCSLNEFLLKKTIESIINNTNKKDENMIYILL